MGLPSWWELWEWCCGSFLCHLRLEPKILGPIDPVTLFGRLYSGL